MFHITLSTRAAALAVGLAALAASTPAQASADPFVGALMPFAGRVGGGACPSGWAPANGQLLPIPQNTALFSLLGTTYGGNGTSTFGLPDLRGRVPIGLGQGPGLTEHLLGEQGGSTSFTLTAAQMPAHTHTLLATDQGATHAAPGEARTLSQAQNAGVYAAGGSSVELGPSGLAGQSLPVDRISPYLAITWCIALQGNFPPRQ